MLGLDRLSKSAREMVQTSELSKEVLIQASREKDPEKQLEILEKASEERKTVRQIRNEERESKADKTEKTNEKSNSYGEKKSTVSETDTFSEWTWKSPDQRFVLTIRFCQEHSENKKADLIRKSLEEALRHTQDLNDKLD